MALKGQKSGTRYSFGFGGGNSRAVTGSEKPIRLWLPSQKGLLALWPQRQREITVRPESPKAAPVGSKIPNSPSIRMGPFVKTVILVGIQTDGITPDSHVPFSVMRLVISKNLSAFRRDIHVPFHVFGTTKPISAAWDPLAFRVADGIRRACGYLLDCEG